MKNTVVLVVLDGWGIGRKDNSNPIYLAKPGNIEYIKHHYPAGSLQASGMAVGLPWNEEGSSEVGHMTIGAGKMLLEHLPRISLAIKDGSFSQNGILLEAFAHARQNNSKLNFVGLLTEGSSHAYLEHLLALLELAKQQNFTNFKLHLITDGRDGAPQCTPQLLKKLPIEKSRASPDDFLLWTVISTGKET